MDPTCLKILFWLFIGYTVIPTVFIRLVSLGAISRLPRGSGRIALTFDDGPDPRYTPRILEILKRYQIKACFFIVGAKARAHPELVRQIAGAGHEIGNHGFKHKIIWLLTPRATTREIMETNRAIEELTGQKIRFCRPPWGLFNLFSILYCRLKGLTVVLWTYMSWDWSKKATPESIAEKALSRARDGAILIFHDSDTTPGAAEGGPDRVVAALPMILDGLQQRGLQVAPLEEVIPEKKSRPALKEIFRKFWGLVELAIRKATGIKDLGEDNSSIWRVALRRYRGRDWAQPDGTVLRKGDYYLELHANNDRLMSLIDENTPVERLGLITMRELKNGLPVLAELISGREEYRKVKFLMGITLLHRGSRRLGFTAHELKPAVFRAAAGLYERWLLSLFHPGGLKALKAYRERLTPKYVVMTRQELFKRYLP